MKDLVPAGLSAGRAPWLGPPERDKKTSLKNEFLDGKMKIVDLEPFLAEFGLNSVRIGLSVKNWYRNMY